MASPFALYIHVPFCQHVCPYCDFNTSALGDDRRQAQLEKLLDALSGDIRFYASESKWKERPIRSVYLGGGTPSLLSERQLNSLFKTLSENFHIREDSEITIECNPEDLSKEKLDGYLDAGVNRISVGVQSFQPDVLKFLGRQVSPEQNQSCLELIQQRSSLNFSADLMFGIPGQELSHLEQDLTTLLRFNPPHISTYGLTLELGTPLYRSHAQGRFVMPPTQEVCEQDALISKKLEEAGVLRYEISNFARSGFESSHNSWYWGGGDYLGLGPGAHSFASDANASVRSATLKDFEAYVSALPANRGSWSETLTPSQTKLEFIYLSLRQRSGLKFQAFHEKFGTDFLTDYREELENPEIAHLLIIEAGSLRLSNEGFLLLDSVASYFA